MAFKTGDEWRRQKELEEARKAGLAPAEVDEDGKEINPHIPQYMTTAPWYLNSDKPTLKHQRNWKEKGQDDLETWYERGVKTFQATKYRKGACENCGSLGHKVKDCLERPRSKGAKFTNKNIAADDKIQDLPSMGFEGKRDRWNGWKSDDYNEVVDRYDQIDALRREMKKKEQLDQIANGDLTAAEAAAQNGIDEHKQAGVEDDVDDADDAKLADDEDVAFGEVKKRVRTVAGGASGSTRNLRIREDTAKYLLNLDMNSAHYDPKSRSMREDPNPDKPAHEKFFAGDNFVRNGGEYSAWQSLTVHSHSAHEKGLDVHMQANPSLAELLHKQFREKKDKMQTATKVSVEEKYGNVAAPLPDDVKELLASERYVEYDRAGRVVKGSEVVARSQYEEDVYVNNHTSVWGSWWKDGTWGFACCHQCVKNSYCTGKVVEISAEEAEEAMAANMAAAAARKEADLKKRQESKLNDYSYRADTWGAEAPEAELDPEKVKAAMKKLDKREREASEADAEKRKFNSLEGGEHVTPEEMEAYRIKKSRGEDPLLAAKAGTVGADGYEIL